MKFRKYWYLILVGVLAALAIAYYIHTSYYAVSIATPMTSTCANCPGIAGACTPESGYYYCYEYTYGDAHVKVQLTPLWVCGDAFCRGLVAKSKVTGTGTLHGYWWMKEPNCDQDGCNAIDIGTYGYTVFGVYDVYIPGVSTASERDIYVNEEAGFRLKDTGILCLWKTQPGYYWIGHSRTTYYWAYAYLGFYNYRIESAIVPEEITINPSQPIAGEPFKVTLKLHNYCEYDAAQKMRVVIYDSNGNPVVYTNWFVVWVSGNGYKTYQVPEQMSVPKDGDYRIVVEIINGETFEKRISIVSKPIARVTVENIVGYIAVSSLTIGGIILILRRIM